MNTGQAQQLGCASWWRRCVYVVATAVVAVTLVGILATPARAGGVHFFFGLGLPLFPVVPSYYEPVPYPYYAPPAPVYVAPPPPVYYAPGPYWVGSYGKHYSGWGGHRGWARHGGGGHHRAWGGRHRSYDRGHGGHRR